MLPSVRASILMTRKFNLSLLYMVIFSVIVSLPKLGDETFRQYIRARSADLM